MKVLAIGSDRKLFQVGPSADEAGSAVTARQIKYGKLFERLDIIVFSLGSLGLKSKKLASNLVIYPTNSLIKLFYIFDALKIAKSLDKPDIVTAQDPFESGLVAFLVSRYFKTPLHLQVHTDFLSPYFTEGSTLNKIRILLAKFLIKRAVKIRVVSERIKKSVVEAGLKRAEAIDVLPIFVDSEEIKKMPIKTDLHKKYPQFDLIILMASRVSREKNIELAIEAMEEIIKKHPKTGLIIVGDGPEKAMLQLLAARRKLQTNIVFEDWSDDLPSYYKTADLFLLTSNYEGYGLTVVEALSAGLPIIMSDVGVAGEVLLDGQNGLVFPVGVWETLVDCLDRFLSDSTLRESLKQGAENFHYGLTEKKYLEEYEKSLDLHRGTR